MRHHARTRVDRRPIPARIITCTLALAIMCALGAITATDGVARQKGTIGWADGTGWKGAYLIEQSVYPTASAIPRVTVTLRPKRPNRVVILEAKDPSTGKWVRDDSRVTKMGRADLRVNPLCEGNVWCDSAFTYRVRVLPKGKEKGLVSNTVRLTFVPTPVAEAAPAPEAVPDDTQLPPVVPPPTASPFLGCRFNGKQLWGKIFVANYTWQADVKIAVVPYTWQADLRVQEVPNTWQATSCGKWAFVDHSWQADLKIAYVDYTWQADVKVASVAYAPGLNR